MDRNSQRGPDPPGAPRPSTNGGIEPPRFVTDTGTPVPAVTAEQMRVIDRIAMDVTGPNLFQMMENAGRNLASEALRLLGPAWRNARVTVLAGTGGNGGGGICAARHLANRRAQVTLVLADRDRLTGIAASQLMVFHGTSGRETEAGSPLDDTPDLVIDALIGYGLGAQPRGRFADLIEWANSAGAPILSLDVPSGVEATTGLAPGVFVRPHATVTLALPKTGLFTAETGNLVLADIGIPAAAYHRAGLEYSSPFDERFRIPLRHS